MEYCKGAYSPKLIRSSVSLVEVKIITRFLGNKDYSKFYLKINQENS